MIDSGLRAYAKTCEPYFLMPGYVYVSKQRSVLRTVLGSCVSVCLHDTKLRYGGMNHFLLPEALDQSRTARYGEPAMYALLKAFKDFGSRRSDLVAHIIGGAGQAVRSSRIGHQNFQAARTFLAKYGIPVLSEDIGGSVGRKVLFLTEVNQLLVFKLEQVRAVDFYDYRDRRRELYGAHN